MQMPQDLNEFCDNFNKKHKNLRFYLRDRKGRLVGMLLAYKDNRGVKLGWSKCKVTEDTFRKDFALYLAVKRAAAKGKNKLYLTKEPSDAVPHSVAKALEVFLPRVRKYFKLK